METNLGKGFAGLQGRAGNVTISGEKEYFSLRVAKTRSGSNFQRITLSREELEELRNNINHVLITTQ